MTAPTYLHGTSADEQARLSRMNEFLNDAHARELTVAPGSRVLDVGCGLGQFTRRLATAVGPTGSVVAVERSQEQLGRARQLASDDPTASIIDWREGDAVDLPLAPHEQGGFDLAHARFVLEHVGDPLAVVRAMVGAVRAGGRIVLADDDHSLLRLHPELPTLAQVWADYVRVYDRNGNDPFVGRRLVSLLHAAGAQPVRNTLVFFGGCAGMPVFPSVVDNLAGVLRSARAAILRVSASDGHAFDAALADLAAWAKRPDAAIWFGMCWAEGVRPE